MASQSSCLPRVHCAVAYGRCIVGSFNGGEGKAAAKGSPGQKVNGDSLMHEWNYTGGLCAPAGEGSEAQAHSTRVLDSMLMSWS